MEIWVGRARKTGFFFFRGLNKNFSQFYTQFYPLNKIFFWEHLWWNTGFWQNRTKKGPYFHLENRHILTPNRVQSVPDLPLPGPWARLKFRAPSVKIKAREPHGMGSRGQGVTRHAVKGGGG